MSDPGSVPRPAARREGILSAQLDHEILLYDEGRQLACRLNRTAAEVWQLSDGRRTVGELAELVSPGAPDPELVLVALDELQEKGLLESGYPERDAAVRRLDRRRFMRRLGAVGAAAAAAAPFVQAVAMPTPAQAISGVAPAPSPPPSGSPPPSPSPPPPPPPPPTPPPPPPPPSSP